MQSTIDAFDVGAAAGFAVLSTDKRYRYTLERRWNLWGTAPRFVLWLMLNPSTADATAEDATVRRCMGYARDWGYTGILVGNLYAFRSTNPALLYSANDPVGPDNDDHLRELIRRASLIVCAWGQRGPIDERRWDVLRMLKAETAPAHALKFNAARFGFDAEPGHPLYLAGNLEPKLWDYLPDRGPVAGS